MKTAWLIEKSGDIPLYLGIDSFGMWDWLREADRALKFADPESADKLRRYCPLTGSASVVEHSWPDAPVLQATEKTGRLCINRPYGYSEETVDVLSENGDEVEIRLRNDTDLPGQKRAKKGDVVSVPKAAVAICYNQK